MLGAHLPDHSTFADITGANFAFCRRIFRDRIQWYNRKDATQFWKTPAELTIAYLAKSVAHEVGHALGLADHTDQDNMPGGTIMDSRIVSDAEYPFDWPEYESPISDRENRRNYAILAVMQGVTFELGRVRAAAGDQIKLNQLINTLQGMSDKPVEVRPSGAVYWVPSPDKMKFTQDQIERMRYSLNPLRPWAF